MSPSPGVPDRRQWVGHHSCAEVSFVPGHVLLETYGRRTGKRRRTVVGMHIENGTGWVVAEHGQHAGYVRNLQADPNVRVRIARRWRPARKRKPG